MPIGVRVHAAWNTSTAQQSLSRGVPSHHSDTCRPVLRLTAPAFAPRLPACSDLAHVTHSELCAATPGLTPLLARRLRWLWYVRGWCANQGLPAEDWHGYEEDYERMQDFYAKRAWA